MRKSKKTKATFDAIDSLTPEEAGDLLSNDDEAELLASATAWKIERRREADELDKLIGSKSSQIDQTHITLGNDELNKLNGYGPYDPIINPPPTISPWGGTTSTIISSINISDLEKRIEKLEEESQRDKAEISILRAELDDLLRRVRKGGFWAKPGI